MISLTIFKLKSGFFLCILLLSGCTSEKIAIDPHMVVIPAGSFRMGDINNHGDNDEKPVHTVRITSFAIGKYEVTFDEYDIFARATGRHDSDPKGWSDKKPDDQLWGRGQRPVIYVNWQDASAYAEWLSRQTGKKYRLPTEAEWEYAARAGTETAFSFGDCINTDQANYDGKVDFNHCGANTGIKRGKTTPVQQLAANPWGLYNIHGNVFEWTQDCWHDSYKGSPVDGSAWLESEKGDCLVRVARGGSWLNEPVALRSASRGKDFVDRKLAIIGFRLARSLEK